MLFLVLKDIKLRSFRQKY